MPSLRTEATELYNVLRGDPESRVIIHVPHAGLHIPEKEVGTFALRGDELESEARLMADIHTDNLAREVYAAADVKPWVFINNVSRLVFDPERFVDEREEMNAVGMGFAYEKTADQQTLRVVDAALSNRLLHEYYNPYAQSLAKLTRDVLATQGWVTIIDLHSYAVEALPYELHKDGLRPAVCLGVDKGHTGWDLVDEAEEAFFELGSVELNTPFSGSYVPSEFYFKNSRVQSIMFEIRKDTYGFGDPESEGFRGTVQAIGRFVSALKSKRK